MQSASPATTPAPIVNKSIVYATYITLFVSLILTIPNIVSFITFKYNLILLVLTVVISVILEAIEMICKHIIKIERDKLSQVSHSFWSCVFIGELALFCGLLLVWMFHRISGTIAWEVFVFSYVPITTYIYIAVDITALYVIFKPDVIVINNSATV